MRLCESLNLKLAWDKTKRNIENNQKAFVNNPHIAEIIDRNKNKYIRSLYYSIDNGYSPSDARVINVPKKNWNIRPGRYLKIKDATIYSAIVLSMYDDIRERIKWSGNDCRYSRVLLDDIGGTRWMEKQVRTWNKYNEKTRELANEYDYVVLTDINSYFENIDHRLLDSKIRTIYDNDDVRSLLRDCLRRWHRPKSRGLPQGYYPSNILSELYFDSIDRRLRSKGICHARYSDDLVLFCDDKEDAINSLRYLIKAYRENGLYLNRKKTKVLTSDEALEEFKNPKEIIADIKRKIGDRVQREKEKKREEIQKRRKKEDTRTNRDVDVVVDDIMDDVKLPYTDGGTISYSEMSDDEKVKVLERAFDEHIKGNEPVDGTLFRYLIRRMGYVDSYYAVTHCMRRIEDGGPDIRRILDKYFSNLENKKSLAEKMMDMILSGEVPYEYHKFAIVRWIFQAGIESEEILAGMRRLLKKEHEIKETKNYIISYMGEYGKSIDIRAIFEMYPISSNDIRKSIILMGIRNMESGMRATIYNQAERDHQYCDFSIDLAKEKA